jgi:hypothetical protein
MAAGSTSARLILLREAGEGDHAQHGLGAFQTQVQQAILSAVRGEEEWLWERATNS